MIADTVAIIDYRYLTETTTNTLLNIKLDIARIVRSKLNVVGNIL